MRAKIDENMPVDAVRLLVDAGWDTSDWSARPIDA